MRLSGRTALVTGGTSGIGQAVAALLAAEGARVAIAGRRPEGAALATALGPDAAFLHADLARPEEASRLVEQTIDRFGRLDVLFNGAGILRWGPVAERTLVQLDDMLAVHLRATFALCQAALPVMSGGSIINVASIVALKAVPGSSLSATVKGAVISLTRALAVEAAPRGVRVNAVLPGLIDTPMLREALESGGDYNAEARALSRGIPFGRFGTAAEVAQAVLFLADPATSGYITGTILNVDGGMAAT